MPPDYASERAVTALSESAQARGEIVLPRRASRAPRGPLNAYVMFQFETGEC
jgi:hypothetical protein